MNTKEEVIKQYLKSLEAANYNAILNLFTLKAMVQSPIYGFIKASQFYKDLLDDTSNSKITLKNIFIGTSNPDSAAAQFEYIWTLNDGQNVIFEVVDIFDFDSSNKINKLTIVYDTHKIRLQIPQLAHR